jgi:predicted RNA binding protein YcfA (HicA-like mRNA interferase family)
VKVKDIIKRLKQEGWKQVRMRGSHRQFKHALKKGRVTVSGKPSDNVAPGTTNSIFKHAGWK